MKTVPYGKWQSIGKHVRARFHNAGHIVGSAFIEVRVNIAEREETLVFSGDLGRYGVPLHTDPAPPPPFGVLAAGIEQNPELARWTAEVLQREAALTALATSLDTANDANLPSWLLHPLFRPLRNDARFRKIVSDLGVTIL